MKIETKEKEWQPIVVTIETREEAEELYNHIDCSPMSVKYITPLWDILRDRLE